MKLWLTSTMIFALSAGACALPPEVDSELVERPPAVKAIEDELRKSPHDIRIYQRLIDYDFSIGDFANAKRTALQCVDANPKSADAWMLAAQVHRTMLELSLAEEALKQASKYESENPEVPLMALSSFFAEVGKFEASARIADRARTLVSTLEVKAFNHVAQLRRGGDYFEHMNSTSEPIPSLAQEIIMSRPTVERVFSRLNLHSGIPLSEEEGRNERLEEVAPVLLRLVHLYKYPKNILSSCKNILEASEDSDVRFACYFTQWQLELIAESKRTIPGISAKAEAIAIKLDQIDDRHPMWLMRRYQAARAQGQGEVALKIQEKMRSIGLPVPEHTPALAELFTYWAIEDASRLGLAEVALAEMQELKTVPESLREAFVLQKAELLRAAGQHQEARSDLERYLHASMGSASDSLKYALFIQRIYDGEAKQVDDELANMAAKEEPFAVPLSSIAWLRALIDYHLKR